MGNRKILIQMNISSEDNFKYFNEFWLLHTIYTYHNNVIICDIYKDLKIHKKCYLRDLLKLIFAINKGEMFKWKRKKTNC